MLGYIVQRFLGNTVKYDLDLRRKLCSPLYIQLHRDARPAGHSFTQLPEQFFYRCLYKRCRSQLEKECTHLSQRPPGQLLEFIKPLHPFIPVPLPYLRHHFCNNARRKQCLGDSIMEIACQPVPLCHNSSLLCLLLEPCIVDGQGSLVCK